MDFLQPPEAMAAQMAERGVKADYVFFYSYIQPAPKDGGSIWSAAEELVKVNSAIPTPLLNHLLTSSSQPSAQLPLSASPFKNPSQDRPPPARCKVLRRAPGARRRPPGRNRPARPP